LLPGHPLGLLPGVPLDWLGLTVLVMLGCVVFGGGPTPQPLRGAADICAAQPLGGGAFLLFLIGLKLALWYLAPSYGLAASYYPRARISGTPERSTEYRGVPYTRVEQSPAQNGFALHFFNDVERFNYYEAPDPDRQSLPF